jgi:hypothetical protein
MNIFIQNTYILLIDSIIQNGLYIPIVFGLCYLSSNHLFLSTIISLKLYSTNYFYWFNNHYSYPHLPKQFNWIRQFVRFTDTGHIINFVYYFYPPILPVAYNVHFVITLGYWVGKTYYHIKDNDSVKDKLIIKPVEHTFCTFNHSLPLVYFTYESIYNKQFSCFGFKSLFYSYIWIFNWYLFIYVPWRYFTQDYVYDFMHPNTSFYKKWKFIGFLYLLFIIGNLSGYCLSIL